MLEKVSSVAVLQAFSKPESIVLPAGRSYSIPSRYKLDQRSKRQLPVPFVGLVRNRRAMVASLVPRVPYGSTRSAEASSR